MGKINLKNQIIGILSGGMSNEREVSLRSGKNIFRILSEHGYKVVFLDLTQRDQLSSLIRDNHIDIIFNALHGFYGEDGKLQADLDFLGIPYTGCNVSSSVVGMNKYWTKLLAHSLGLTTAKYAVIEDGDLWQDIQVPFDFPWFVKPMQEGSSQDTYIIRNEEEKKKLTLSHKEYLIEELIIGEEVTSGILTSGGEKITLPILKLLAHNEFYDYEAKYTEGKTEFFCPAPIEDVLRDNIQNQSLQMHTLLGCNGATRCDYIIEQNTRKPYFLEINTSPGMTELSDIPIEAKAFGWSEIQLCEFILHSALRQ